MDAEESGYFIRNHTHTPETLEKSSTVQAELGKKIYKKKCYSQGALWQSNLSFG